MKQLKQRTLFVLDEGVGFLQPTEHFRYLSYNQLYWRLKDYKRGSVRGAINELIISGLVDRLVRGRRPYFRITKTGREKLGALFRLSRWAGQLPAKSWDKSWRLLIFYGKIKAGKRRSLRLALADYGFTRLERGVYVSPFGVEKIFKSKLNDLGLIGSVRLLITKRFVVGDDRAFASQVWRLNTIYNKYQQLISRALGVLYRALREKSLVDQLKDAYRSLLYSWFEVLKADPGLPKQLLPADWPHLEGVRLMAKLGKSVRELEETVNIS